MSEKTVKLADAADIAGRKRAQMHARWEGAAAMRSALIAAAPRRNRTGTPSRWLTDELDLICDRAWQAYIAASKEHAEALRAYIAASQEEREHQAAATAEKAARR